MKNPDHHDLRYRCHQKGRFWADGCDCLEARCHQKGNFGQMGAFVWNPGVIRKVDFGQMGLSGGQVSSER